MIFYSLKRFIVGLWFVASVGFAATPFYVVTDYGVVGDGAKSCTAGIQKAIDTCSAAGGGKVVFPAGTYLSGPIFLKRCVQIELEPGATLLGSTNMGDYPVMEGRWEGIERKIYSSLLTGEDLDHVSIVGGGTIDARGAIWWDAEHRTAVLRKSLGIKGRESDNPLQAPLRWPRPRTINLYHCTNVLVRDITILNSPSWTVHPVYCQNVTIDNVTIKNPADSPNTDAIDPDSCNDVRISNCHFDVGDDCVVIKSGYNEDGRRVGIPCENILVNNCTFARGHAGVGIGSEMSGSVRNVVVDNCIFDGTDRGLRVKTSMGRGGVVENFRASNLIMRNITDAAFSVTATYDAEQKEIENTAAPEAVPTLRNFHWDDVIIVEANKVADIRGLAESPLADFSLRNIQVISTKTGLRFDHAQGVALQNISLQPTSGPAVEMQNVRGGNITHLAVLRANQGSPVVSFEDVSRIWLQGCEVTEGQGVFLAMLGQDNRDIHCDGNRLATGIKTEEVK